MPGQVEWTGRHKGHAKGESFGSRLVGRFLRIPVRVCPRARPAAAPTDLLVLGGTPRDVAPTVSQSPVSLFFWTVLLWQSATAGPREGFGALPVHPVCER